MQTKKRRERKIRILPDIDTYHLDCCRETLAREKPDSYLKICDMMKELPGMYILQPIGCELRCETILRKN